MLDYWKAEANAREFRGAEENKRLRNLFNAQQFYSAMLRVVNRHAVKGFAALREKSSKTPKLSLAIEVANNQPAAEGDKDESELSPTPRTDN